jgi:hypothetical protein
MVGNPGNNQPINPGNNQPITRPFDSDNYISRDDTVTRTDLTKLDVEDHLAWVKSKLGSNENIPRLNQTERRVA